MTPSKHKSERAELGKKEKTMKVVGLISGGKDSCYNLMQCVAAGHEIVALANLMPQSKTEIDSYMYQSVGHEAIDLIAEAMQLPLYRKEITGDSKSVGINYSYTSDDEVEDLFELLQNVKDDMPIEGVSVGAILSDYQRNRVENVCSRLQLTPLAYLWQRNQQELLCEMIKCEVDAIVIKVAALGLEPSRHLGRSLRLLEPHLMAMHDKYGLNVCGEGGEYETLVLDCPLFGSRIVIEASEVILHSANPIAPVGFLKLNKLKLEPKLPQLNFYSRLKNVPLSDSDGYITDHGEEATEFVDDNTSSADETVAHTVTIKTVSCCPELNAVSNDGWLWISGLCGNSASCEEALKMALEKLKSTLSTYGHTLEDVVSVSMLVSDMSKFVELNKLYVDVIKHVNPPTRACVEVPLPKNCPVILEVVSWSLPDDAIERDPPIERHTMHIQSISHWAPANIGPYSQAIRVGEFVYIAGQIGLVPGSMQLVRGGVKSQCQLAIRHVGRIISGIDSNTNLRDVVQAVCYVTNIQVINNVRKLWEATTNNAIVNYVVVSGLPKNALVEWHVWVHRHNSSFEYEETGKCVNDWSISIYRRWNYENNISAVVCHVDCPQDETDTVPIEVYQETFRYVIQKLQLGHEGDSTSICNLKIFYNVQKAISLTDVIDCINEFEESITVIYLLVPVVGLYSEQTFLSICGVRKQ
ncbi:hypothetical protein PPYR_07056 [Photinus pyralis]|uniref:Diphthine--ammonia ligase n=2 Tax=Photinus pyralis TaxID=7054 RepID=A0A5N4APE3_PHOPY|nr:hypothetical protein PPYR_07056 [Photinus pyralis]